MPGWGRVSPCAGLGTRRRLCRVPRSCPPTLTPWHEGSRSSPSARRGTKPRQSSRSPECESLAHERRLLWGPGGGRVPLAAPSTNQTGLIPQGHRVTRLSGKTHRDPSGRGTADPGVLHCPCAGAGPGGRSRSPSQPGWWVQPPPLLGRSSLTPHHSPPDLLLQFPPLSPH